MIQSKPHVHLFHSVAQLKEEGLSDPVEELITDLKQHSELIPMKGILGGTMQFRNEKTWVITDRWVLAHFDDGHVGGTLLLEYSVQDGAVQWTVVGHAPH